MRNHSWKNCQLASGICIFIFASNAHAQLSATELDRLIAGDPSNSDAMGWSVDVDGNRAVIGAPKDDDVVNGANTGAAYVFLRNTQTGEWEQEEKLVMQGAAAGDEFGTSVAISGDTIVVGAPQDDATTGSWLHGSAHVFTLDAGSWDSGVELLTDTPDTSETQYANYGISVDIDGDTLVVGVAYDAEQGTASGSSFVFERTGQTWSEVQKLLPGVGADQNFGWSVGIDQTTIIVGAPHWTNSGVGEAYVHTRSGGVWPVNGTQLSPADNLATDNFGWSVAISGDQAVVGARFDDDAINGQDAGSINIFERSSGVWSSGIKLTASNGEANDQFGFDVATNGEAVMVGAIQNGSFNRGSVYLFTDPGSGWAEDDILFPVTNITNVSAIVHFGSGVAVDLGTMVVGARNSDVADGMGFKFGAGAAFAYGVNTTAISSATSANQVVIKAPAGSYLSDVGAYDPESLGTLPPDSSFPLGAVGFQVNGLTPGAAIEVELLYPDSVMISSYYKFSDHWYEFLDDGTTGAVITTGKVTLKLVDGERGDHDSLVNGVIIDPGAPSENQISVELFDDGFEDP
ncbi:MAG TPA: FG-GAP repeat protein [Xanthomonadales bacterium]|nr:FG-GAP repeat protein [Xanthomonadales bacterium]